MNKNVIWGILIITSLFFFCGKGHKKKAVGKRDVIMVLSDDRIYTKFQSRLNDIFQKEVMTPQPEKLYKIVKGTWEEFDVYKKWRNILLIGALNSSDPISQFIIKSLDQETVKLIQINQAFMFMKKNVWASDQGVMFLIAKNDSLLDMNLDMYSTQIFTVMDRSVDERVKNWLYEKDEKITVSNDLKEKYHFSIRIPHFFHFAKNMPDSNFLWFTAAAPERWIFIKWRDIEEGEEIEINQNKAVFMRDSLSEIFYSKDSVNKEYTSALKTELNGMDAIRLQGLWENDSLIVGGPFINYQFFDRNTRRYYMIDGAIFAAGLEKSHYIKQLDVIINTFRTYSQEQGETTTAGE